MSDPSKKAVDASHGPIVTAWGRVESDIAGGLRTILEAGRQSHRETMERLGLGGDAPADANAWDERIEEYRAGVREALLRPLRDHVAPPGPGSAAATLVRSAIEDARAAVSELPEAIEAPWPADALAPRASDSRWRRLGKVFGRVFSSARKAGQTRSIPIRSVAVRHLELRVVGEEDRALRAHLDEWVRWTGLFDRALAHWAETSLPVLLGAPEGEEARSEAWAALGTAAEAFDERLTELYAGVPGGEGAGNAAARLGVAQAGLEGDMTVAGSFVFGSSERPARAPLGRFARGLAAVEDWNACLQGRLGLLDETLGIDAGTSEVRRRLRTAVRERSAPLVDRLRPAADELDRLASSVREGAPGAPADPSKLVALVHQALDPLVEEAAGFGAIVGEVRREADAVSGGVSAIVREAPEALEIAPEGATAAGGRRVDRRVVPFRDLARQSFDALRLDRARVAAESLAQPVEALGSEIAGLPEVLTFASEAPPSEAKPGDTAEAPEDDEGDEGEAMEIVLGALDNIADSLGARSVEFERALSAADDRLRVELKGGTRKLWERIDARRLQAQLIAAGSRLAQLRSALNERWGPPVDRAWAALRQRLRAVVRLARRGLRRGSELVGGAQGERAESVRSIRLLADPTELTGSLPLVYQRLFTFEPLSDAQLLVGREGELSDAMSRFRRWRDSDGVPTVVLASQGTGLTSFMNALASQLGEEDASVHRLALPDRISDEPRLARHLAREFGCDEVDTLDALAEVLFDVEQGGLPDAVLVDDMEHLYLRVPGGTDLIERFLTLMAETEPRIFWIGGVARPAWQLVTKAEPTAVSQVDVLDLPVLPPAQMRAGLIKRHRRSGLPLHWEAPEGRAIQLRQRVRRIRDPEALDRLFEDDFFDRITRSSGGDIRLALFQWLASADFERSDGLALRTPKRPDVSLLESLDLTQNFTLKALLEHRTLTLAEHDRIFRLPRHESYQIFEALGNRNLISAVAGPSKATPDRSEVEEDLRYQIRPLLVGPITAHLRARNIVH